MKTSMKTTLLAIIIAVASAQALAADITESALMQAATDLGQRYDSNYAVKDADAMAGLYAHDGILVSPGGAIVRGHDALVAYYKNRFASGASGHHIKVLEAHVKGNGGYAITEFSVTVPKASGEIREERGHIVVIYQRDADGWHLQLVEPSVPESTGK